MSNTKHVKHTRVGLELLGKLAEEGKKIFFTSDAMDFAAEVGISPKYLPAALMLLKQDGWIIPLKKGMYALSKAFSSEPLHEFEIAMALVSPAAISHWSALHHHGLTDQISRKIFVTTTLKSSIPRSLGKIGVTIQGVPYIFSRIKEERFFGVKHAWVNGTKIYITDIEKTLLDGLMKPQYCGGFGEVYHAFQMLGKALNLEKIISYALKLDISVIKRLGWVLTEMGYELSKLAKLQKVKKTGYIKLNVSGSDKGTFNSTWMIRENFYD